MYGALDMVAVSMYGGQIARHARLDTNLGLWPVFVTVTLEIVVGVVDHTVTVAPLVGLAVGVVVDVAA